VKVVSNFAEKQQRKGVINTLQQLDCCPLLPDEVLRGYTYGRSVPEKLKNNNLLAGLQRLAANYNTAVHSSN
jgi:hypothetical protein